MAMVPRIRRSVIGCLVAMGLHAGALAQDHWARRVGSWSNDALNDLTVDADGNLYVAGEFGGNVGLPGATLISNGSLDAVVAKYDATGLLLWVRTFGGTGLDRAIKLALTPDGQIAVVGQFMGAVDFGGITLNSLGGTQDCFTLKMAQSDGAVSWVRRGGSGNGVDQPNGVSVGPDGSIAVAGEFRGAAVFDQGSITSITDPTTGQPSVDIFLATYASDGAPLWLVHGAAEFADRGMDVAHDADGKVYLTGQFTDTLMLAGIEHPNAMYSAVLIARFSPSGQEEWFRVFGGGTYNQVFEMTVVDDGYLLLVGDLQGTVIFLDTQPDMFTAAAPRSSFLMQVGLDGEFMEQRTWGSEHPLTTRALSVQDDDISVLGRFSCQLTGFTDQYGESSFLASGPWDLYVARFQTSDLDFKQAQQFAGIGEKLVGGIVHAPDAELIFCGAFEHGLAFPSDGLLSVSPASGGQSAPAPMGYCSDDHYPLYGFLRGSSLKDGFIVRGYLDGREPHDPYARDPGPCDRSFRPPAIRLGETAGVHGPDTLSRCGIGQFRAYTFTAYTPDTTVRHNAPDFRFAWSTGATTPNIDISVTGWYWVDVSVGQQCLTWRDSAYIIINPIPALPRISDDVVVNTEALFPQEVRVCEPQQPWLWVTGVDPTHEVVWSLQGGVLAVDDSVQAVTSGFYVATVTSLAGCQRWNHLNVYIDPVGPLPPFDIALTSVYPQDTDLDDTLRLCWGDEVSLQVTAALTLNGAPSGLTYAVRPLYRCGPFGPWSPTPALQLGFSCDFGFAQEGWYTHTFGFALTNAPCGVDTIFMIRTDSIYVIPLPVMVPQLTASGGGWICPGDTAVIVGGCANCSSSAWGGPGIAAINGDSLLVVTAGNYFLTGITTTPEGCTNFGMIGVVINWTPLPPLYVDPLDAIICPNDSAAIWTTAPGSDWQWFGPLGPLSIVNDTIHTTQQGVYYLEMTDTLGCRVTSNPILVTDYATPFLNVLPDNVICEPGETSTLQVVTTSQSTLLWEAPFAGSNAVQQVVSQPGIYTCSVNACGITTVLSVEIFGNNADASLTVDGPYTLCPGGPLVLQATPGQVIYYWEPGPIFSPSLSVTEPGSYLLLTGDANGCRDSLWAEVVLPPPFEPLALLDTVFCMGAPMVATVSGDPAITWYGDAQLTQVLATGNALNLGMATQTTTVWVEQVAGPCSTGMLEVELLVSEPPEEPVLTGPFAACIGDSLLLLPLNSTAAAYAWSTPGGVVQGPELLIDPVTSSAAGTYALQATNPGCAPVSASFVLVVNMPEALFIGNDTLICPGGTAPFALPTGFTQPIWADGSTQPVFVMDASGAVVLNALDGNGCQVADTAWVSVFAFGLPLTTTGSTICLGADATLLANGSGVLQWYADSTLGQLVHTGPQWFFGAPMAGASYYVTQSEGVCTSEASFVSLVVVPTPMDAAIQATQPVCLGAPFTLALTGSGDPTGAWTTPTGSFTGPSLIIPAASLSDQGAYAVVPMIGACAGDTLTILVQVLASQPPALADTAFCDGASIVLAVTGAYTGITWSTGAAGPAVTIAEGGSYTVEATDAQGCLVSATVLVTAVHCDDVVPNVITPNGDGWNDGWRMPRGTYAQAHLRVHNRWGQLVWEGDVLHNSFRGLHSNGEPLSEGTYYYELLLTRADGGVKPRTGHFSLLR